MFPTQATVPGLQPTPYSLEDQKKLTWDNLVYAAQAHSSSVKRAVEGPETGPEADRNVDDILLKGRTLESCIRSAQMHGFTVAEIVAITDLHPAYVNDLLYGEERWSPI